MVDIKQGGVFSHLKEKAKQKAAAKSKITPIPIPFDLPLNYPQNVMEGLKTGMLNGKTFTKFILSITSAVIRYTAYPTTSEYNHMAKHIVAKYPFLSAKQENTMIP